MTNEEAIAQLQIKVNSHERLFRELHVEDLGKPQKDALPDVLNAWVTNISLGALNRRRFAVLVAIAAAAGPIVDIILRYALPGGH